jgi:arsenate reductase
MKVLFICHYNVGRSQMAKAFYNQLTKTNDGEAAGTDVREEGQTLDKRKKDSKSNNFFVIDVMNEVGIDVSAAKRAQVTPEMIKGYDKLISMADKSETPSWLLAAPNYLYWNVKDPRGQSFAITVRAREDIRHRVEQLLSFES